LLGGLVVDAAVGKNQQQPVTAQASPAAPASAADPNSVAVLPFVNLSDDKGSEYFSDGVSEELLTIMQKIPGMHVARAHLRVFVQRQECDSPGDWTKTRVAHLVEGSVRKSGETVRIAARLSRAETGQELWSENFTRDLKDVFAVQTELAQTIVTQLRGQLTGGAAAPSEKEKIQAEVQAAEKAGRRMWKPTNSICRGAFMRIVVRRKASAKRWRPYQRAVELDLLSRWRGRVWPRLTLGIAIFDRGRA